MLGNFQHHPKRVVEIVKSLQDLKSYVAAVMDDQRKQPTGGLICSLMEAEVNGQRLSDEEVIANTIITLIGGHETTTNLIASGFLTLLRNQSAYDQLKIHPEIAASAVEELLRWESPGQHTARIATADMELGSKAIPNGAKVVAVLAAANRDPRRFSEPESLNPNQNRQPACSLWLGGALLFRCASCAHRGPNRVQHADRAPSKSDSSGG